MIFLTYFMCAVLLISVFTVLTYYIPLRDFKTFMNGIFGHYFSFTQSTKFLLVFIGKGLFIFVSVFIIKKIIYVLYCQRFCIDMTMVQTLNLHPIFADKNVILHNCITETSSNGMSSSDYKRTIYDFMIQSGLYIIPNLYQHRNYSSTGGGNSSVQENTLLKRVERLPNQAIFHLNPFYCSGYEIYDLKSSLVSLFHQYLDLDKLDKWVDEQVPKTMDPETVLLCFDIQISCDVAYHEPEYQNTNYVYILDELDLEGPMSPQWDVAFCNEIVPDFLENFSEAIPTEYKSSVDSISVKVSIKLNLKHGKRFWLSPN
nr:hypothetical protein [Nitzschia ovalis]